ncbi:MAG: hypothetical protein Q7R89_03655 [bacterium]|nr:hypothetical protein [bacterium]
MNIKSKQQILDELVKLKPSIIAIDGEDGVGKTTNISPMVASALNASAFSTDDYLDKKKDGYVTFVDYEKLKQEIIKVKKSRPIIIEGMMTLLILEKLELIPDYFIYVCSQMWYDEWLGDNGNYSKSFEEIVSETEKRVSIVNEVITPTSKWTLRGFRKEVYQYTYDRRPFEKAQAVLIVSHNSEGFIL